MSQRALFAAVVIAVCRCSMPTHAGTTPIGTAFTYQGQLKQGGSNVDASADFEISLWDAVSGPNQIGSTQPVNNVIVADGLFHVDLDFGAAAFGTTARWLQIAVRSPAGSGIFTTLTPRQRIQPVPVARFAITADGPNLTNLNASNISSGTVPNAAIGGTYSAPVTLSSASNSFTGGGAGLTGLNAANISTGTLPIARGGTGATSGPTALTSLNAQARVTGSAAVGSYIRAINADGTVVTGVDADTNSGGDITGVTASSGLSGGGTTGTVALSVAANGVTNSMLASDAASLNKVSGGNMSSNATSIGIGTASPQAKLHVDSSSGVSLFLENSAASGWGLQSNTYGADARAIVGLCSALSSNQMAIYGETNGGTGWAGYFQGRGHFADDLGVGTSNPQARLHVDSSTGLGMFVEQSAPSGWAIQANAYGTDGRAIVGLAGSATANQMAIYGETNTSNGWAGYFQGRGFFSDRVGIGTTNPFRKLDIVDTSFGGLSFPMKIVNGGNTAGTAVGMIFQVDDAADTRGKGAIAYERTNTWNRGSFHFLQNQIANSTVASISNSVMTITNTGSVGIGTTSPSQRLHVVGGSTVLEGGLTVGAASTVGINGTTVTGTPSLALSSTGTLSASGVVINLNGTAASIGNSSVGINVAGGGGGFNLLCNGTAAKPGGGSWTVTSDRRLKKNIQPLQSSLEQMLHLRGVTFEYVDPESIHEPSGRRMGMIAQEVEQVFPEWVCEKPDGMKTLAYSGFEALTVEALRQLRTEMDAEIAQLRAEKDLQIQQLRAEIDSQSAAHFATIKQMLRRIEALERTSTP